jgi:glycerophosphoryl diester phosphodiesterase
MLLLGHRGCRGEFMENTFAAFDHALASGHDPRLRGRLIARQEYGTLCEWCRTAGRLPRRPAIALCELEAVLARYAHLAWMDIEVKVPGLEPQVAALLRRYPPARGFVVSSFRRRVLLELHRIDPALPLGFIFDRMPRAKIWRALPVQYLKPKARLVTASRVRNFHAEGKKVLTWTVNRASAMRRLTEAGVDGMIGDDPVLLAQGR